MFVRSGCYIGGSEMKQIRVLRKTFATMAVLFAGWGNAYGQGINIDVQFWGAPPEGGGEVPGDSYGAGSGQVGRWNPIWSNRGPYPLVDLAGNPTGASVYHPAWGNLGAWSNQDLLGDFRSLMADAEDVGAGLDYQFSGLSPGWYDVWTYCGSASFGYSSETFVKVPGAIGQEEVRVAGTMPANFFVLNRSHAIHRVQVKDGSLRILVRQNWPDGDRGFITGFQLVPVPEPLSIIVFSVGIAAFALRRRRRV